MAITGKRYRENWAVDVAVQSKSKGEVKDEEAVNQSIDTILTTGFGERLFNPQFGCKIVATLFEYLDDSGGEQLLDDAIEAIHIWENRVVVLSDFCKLRILPEQHAAIITIPYIIKKTNVTGKYQKKLIF